MALPEDPPIGLNSQGVGTSRSIKLEVTGSDSGSADLLLLAAEAGLTTPVGVLDFLGFAKELEPPGAPKSPTIQLASPPGTAGIEIAWDESLTGGTPENYRVELRNREDPSDPWNGYTFLVNRTYPTNFYVIPHNTLTLGRYYMYRVRAENAAGVSSYTESASIQYTS